MNYRIREYKESDLAPMLAVMNEIIDEGGSFPFTEPMTEEMFKGFIQMEGYAACLADENDEPVGMYMMGVNIPGRCSSIANATYLVKKELRGQHLGELLVRDSLEKAREKGFRLMQFNGVVDSNTGARKLYKRVGFIEAGIIPKGFQVKDGHYEDMHVMYYRLQD